jgi:hypothetical protein
MYTGVNLSSNAYSTGILPPLVPRCEGYGVHTSSCWVQNVY